MDYISFQTRLIKLFLEGQRQPHRKMLEQCNLSLQGEELIIECPDRLATRAIWLRSAHIAKPAPRLGVTSIRFR